MTKWTADDIPDQSGHTALVTGANSGIGLRAASALAGADARVILGCRDPDRASRALEEIRAEHPAAQIETLELDLADLASIERAAAEISERERALDILVNNAGVMAPPRRETADGFELQFGTNHLGHFALTGRLLKTLLAAPEPRVVTVSSMAHRAGSIDFDDLLWERSYSRWPAYGRSKLANLLFTFELARRAATADSTLIAAACHPGYSATNLQTSGPGTGPLGILLKPVGMITNVFLAQSDSMGALPTLYAATAPGVIGGDYIGPDGLRESRGSPQRVGCSSAARDEAVAERLWDVSTELTGVDYAALAV